MRPREGILQNNPSSICKGFGVDYFYFGVFSKADYAISLLNERLGHLEKIKKQCDEDTAVALLLMFDVEWNTSTFK